MKLNYDKIIEAMELAIANTDADDIYIPKRWPARKGQAKAALEALQAELPELTYTTKIVYGGGNLPTHLCPTEAEDNGSELYDELKTLGEEKEDR